MLPDVFDKDGARRDWDWLRADLAMCNSWMPEPEPSSGWPAWT
jgi:hypothetical protein